MICSNKITQLFWCWNFSSKCDSIVVYAHFSYLNKVYLTKWCSYMFLCTILKYNTLLGISIKHFIIQYSKMSIKIGGWKHNWSSKLWQICLLAFVCVVWIQTLLCSCICVSLLLRAWSDDHCSQSQQYILHALTQLPISDCFDLIIAFKHRISHNWLIYLL